MPHQLLATYGDFDIFACNATRQYERYGTKALWKQVKKENARALHSAQDALSKDRPAQNTTDALMLDELKEVSSTAVPSIEQESRSRHRSIATGECFLCVCLVITFSPLTRDCCAWRSGQLVWRAGVALAEEIGHGCVHPYFPAACS